VSRHRHLTPAKIAGGIRRRIFGWLARQLAPALAHTPVFWGDRNRIEIGKDVHLSDTILNCRSGRIVIEDHVFFGHHCLVLTGTHDVSQRNAARVAEVPKDGRDIIIRQGAWVASQVTILGPCEIGAHSVIVAGTIVRENVPEGVVYGGTPPRAISTIAFREPR